MRSKKKIKKIFIKLFGTKKSYKKLKMLNYCVETNKILSIPALTYNDSSRKFTLRKNEKKTPKNNKQKIRQKK